MLAASAVQEPRVVVAAAMLAREEATEGMRVLVAAKEVAMARAKMAAEGAAREVRAEAAWETKAVVAAAEAMVDPQRRISAERLPPAHLHSLHMRCVRVRGPDSGSPGRAPSE